MISKQLVLNVRTCIQKHLLGKDFYFIGYPDVWRFDTKGNVSEYSKKHDTITNSVWSIEYPNNTREVLRKYSQRSDNDYDKFYNELSVPEYRLHEGVRKNIAEILFFQPFLMMPCGSDYKKGLERDEELATCLLKQIIYIGENIKFEDYNSIISFMGYPHIEYVLELNNQLDFLQGISPKSILFK